VIGAGEVKREAPLNGRSTPADPTECGLSFHEEQQRARTSFRCLKRCETEDLPWVAVGVVVVDIGAMVGVWIKAAMVLGERGYEGMMTSDEG
jgi:hypothetical protein